MLFEKMWINLSFYDQPLGEAITFHQRDPLDWPFVGRSMFGLPVRCWTFGV
jgi:hypothetical protein